MSIKIRLASLFLGKYYSENVKIHSENTQTILELIALL